MLYCVASIVGSISKFLIAVSIWRTDLTKRVAEILWVELRVESWILGRSWLFLFVDFFASNQNNLSVTILWGLSWYKGRMKVENRIALSRSYRVLNLLVLLVFTRTSLVLCLLVVWTADCKVHFEQFRLSGWLIFWKSFHISNSFFRRCFGRLCALSLTHDFLSLFFYRNLISVATPQDTFSRYFNIWAHQLQIGWGWRASIIRRPVG